MTSANPDSRYISFADAASLGFARFWPEQPQNKVQTELTGG